MYDVRAAIELVERAFGLARQSGKTDWWAMAIPVLKNRLLQLTDNTFKEADFGVSSFRDFLGRVSEITRIDETPPGFVLLKSAVPEGSGWTPANRLRGRQIRPDLWRAVLDYSSARKYVWDASEKVARPASSDDTGLVLPTASAADLDQWRSEYVTLHKPVDPEIAQRVETWSKDRLPTFALPAQIRPAWNSHLKRKVEQRLQDWFTKNQIEPPATLRGSSELDIDEEEVELREFITACIEEMSKRELLELRISPAVAMRVSRSPAARSTKNER
jgi:hypothetical protein